MRRLFLVSIFVFSVILFSGMPAHGCGDKLLVLGRSVRLQALFNTRGTYILAYQHAGTRGAEVIADSEFQGAIKKAGYQLRIVRDTEELEVALRSGKYELIIADIADASALGPAMQSAPRMPGILPVLYQPTKGEFASVEKQYRYVLKEQRKGKDYISVIDRALEMKLEADTKLKHNQRKPSGAL